VFNKASRPEGILHAGKLLKSQRVEDAMMVLQHANRLPEKDRVQFGQQIKSLIKRRVESKDGEPAFLARFEEMHPVPP
jgi:hypothetical protein